MLYDLQQQKTLSDVTSPPVKYAIWSHDGNVVALLSKHSAYEHPKNAPLLLTYLPSCDNCKQEFVPKLFGARDDPHQARCMGRQWGLRLYDAQSYEVLLAQWVRRYTRAVLHKDADKVYYSDNGIVCTFDQPLYLICIQGKPPTASIEPRAPDHR